MDEKLKTKVRKILKQNGITVDVSYAKEVKHHDIHRYHFMVTHSVDGKMEGSIDVNNDFQIKWYS